MLDKRKMNRISFNLSFFEKQKEYDLALSKNTNQKEDGYKETYNKYK